jgi:hypothetical protein
MTESSFIHGFYALDVREGPGRARYRHGRKSVLHVVPGVRESKNGTTKQGNKKRCVRRHSVFLAGEVTSSQR